MFYSDLKDYFFIKGNSIQKHPPKQKMIKNDLLLEEEEEIMKS